MAFCRFRLELVCANILLLLALNSRAGNDLKAVHGRPLASQGQEKHSLLKDELELSEIAKAKKKGEGIWNNTRLSKEKRISLIITLYEETLPKLQSPQEFIDLIDNNNFRIINSTNHFIEQHFHDFISLKPSFEELLKLNYLTTEVKTGSTILSRSFQLVKKPEDFQRLISQNDPNRMSVAYKLKMADLIVAHIHIFKSTNPHIDDFIKLQNYMFSIQSDLSKTIASIIAIKKVFLGVFEGCDIIILLNHGCDNPHKDYKNALFKLKNENPLIRLRMLKSADILSAKKICKYVQEENISEEQKIESTTQLLINSLPFLKSAKDFINLLSDEDDGKKLPSAYKKARNKFIGSHLEQFFDKKPTIDQIMALNKFITSINTSMKLKNRALGFVKNADDFISLVGDEFISGVWAEDYQAKTIDFVVDKIDFFKGLNPTIDQVMKLQKLIIAIEVDAEVSAAKLIILKEAFVSGFEGADLVRLLLPGREKTTQDYLTQIAALKRRHGIDF